MAISKEKQRMPITLEKDLVDFIREHSASQDRTVSLQISYMIKRLKEEEENKKQ